ncbi:hypothetical protein F5Y03DRAFT_400632 [Xylaria venustula]|nr:hypothetical protein F5Y03DRAFT_400632 [Xylaria venustula]
MPCNDAEARFKLINMVMKYLKHVAPAKRQRQDCDRNDDDSPDVPLSDACSKLIRSIRPQPSSDRIPRLLQLVPDLNEATIRLKTLDECHNILLQAIHQDSADAQAAEAEADFALQTKREIEAIVQHWVKSKASKAASVKVGISSTNDELPPRTSGDGIYSFESNRVLPPSDPCHSGHIEFFQHIADKSSRCSQSSHDKVLKNKAQLKQVEDERKDSLTKVKLFALLKAEFCKSLEMVTLTNMDSTDMDLDLNTDTNIV